jgi:hypothetical protein
MPKSHSGTGVVSDKPTGSFQDSAKKIWDVSCLRIVHCYARLIGNSFALGISMADDGWRRTMFYEHRTFFDRAGQ